MSPTVIFDYPTPSALAEHFDTELAAAAATTAAATTTTGSDQPTSMARFNDITRELQTLLSQPHWNPDERTELSTRLETLLATVSVAALSTDLFQPQHPTTCTTTTSAPLPKASSSPFSTRTSGPKRSAELPVDARMACLAKLGETYPAVTRETNVTGVAGYRQLNNGDRARRNTGPRDR